MVHSRAMWDRHGWVFDLVSDDELRRRRARIRARERDNAQLAANEARNEVWWRAGQTWAPGDPAMAAEIGRWTGTGCANRTGVEKLLLATVRGPYRAEDWRYTRVARHLDSRPLREALGTIADGGDDAAALRAAFVLSRLDNPDLSANRRSYANWLKHRTQT